MIEISILDMSLTDSDSDLELESHLPGANELITLNITGIKSRNYTQQRDMCHACIII